jgi:hypothetical protein
VKSPVVFSVIVKVAANPSGKIDGGGLPALLPFPLNAPLAVPVKFPSTYEANPEVAASKPITSARAGNVDIANAAAAITVSVKRIIFQTPVCMHLLMVAE